MTAKTPKQPDLTDAEDKAMKALLDTHHCGSGEEDKYCGGCVALAWDLVRASRTAGKR